jgi:small subunit ribosomal protein S18
MFKKMRPRKKVCYFTKNHIKFVDYKDIELLSRFVNPDGKIAPRSSTGTSAKYQRELARAVKNARYMGLLGYPGQN